MNYSPTKTDSILIKDALLSDDGGRFAQGWLLLSDGKIADQGFGLTRETACAARVIDGAGKVILPGFTNGHTHLSQSLMAGRADGLDLAEALHQIIWPFEFNMTEDDICLATLLGLVENLHSGVTTVVEHNKTPRPARNLDVAAECATRVGIKMCLVRGWTDLGARSETIHDILQSAEDLYKRFHCGARNLLSLGLGPLACGRCSESSIKELSAWARSHSIVNHIHIAETESEIVKHKQRTGYSPVEWLHCLGALGPEAQLVHCVWVSNRDLDLIAESGATVIHCPVSNSYLGAGIAPINEMLKRRIAVKIGTDGAATNESQNLFESLRNCVLLARSTTMSPRSLDTTTALRMAYQNQPVAGQHPASFTVGAPADVALFPMHGVRGIATPDQSIILNPAAQAQTVIVAGEVALDSGRIVGIDEDLLREKCEWASRRLAERSGIPTKQRSLTNSTRSLVTENRLP